MNSILRHPHAVLTPCERAFLTAADDRCMKLFLPAGRRANDAALRCALNAALFRIRQCRGFHTREIAGGQFASGHRLYQRRRVAEAAQAAREMRDEIARRDRLN